MGLDMYALTLDTRPDSEVDFDVTEGNRLHYWRKHPDLHGWMQRLYRRKGGRDEGFNGARVLLTADDLAELEADIRMGTLPETHGFFFGQSDGSETPDDLLFIAEARDAIAAGQFVFYTSWW